MEDFKKLLNTSGFIKCESKVHLDETFNELFVKDKVYVGIDDTNVKAFVGNSTLTNKHEDAVHLLAMIGVDFMKGYGL